MIDDIFKGMSQLFSGRISRKQYFVRNLIAGSLLISLVQAIGVFWLLDGVLIAVAVAVFVYFLSQMFARFRDMSVPPGIPFVLLPLVILAFMGGIDLASSSGNLMAAVPLVFAVMFFFIYHFVLMLWPGNLGENRYGGDPAYMRLVTHLEQANNQFSMKDYTAQQSHIYAYRGRTDRYEYFINMLLWGFAVGGVIVLGVLLHAVLPLLIIPGMLGLYVLYRVGCLVVKRLHDLGCSGYWLWLLIGYPLAIYGAALFVFQVPFVEGQPPAIVHFLLLPVVVANLFVSYARGQAGPNEYGEDWLIVPYRHWVEEMEAKMETLEEQREAKEPLDMTEPDEEIVEQRKAERVAELEEKPKPKKKAPAKKKTTAKKAPAKKTPVKKAPTKKASAKKPTAKKPAAKKPAAKKAAPKKKTTKKTEE